MKISGENSRNRRNSGIGQQLSLLRQVLRRGQSCSERGQNHVLCPDMVVSKAGQAIPTPEGTAGLHSDTRGAIYVEFLIAFLPVYVFFLCLIQLTILFSSRLVVEHAALHAARAAAVVIGDEPAKYSNEEPHVLDPDGERAKAIRKAVILTLAPLIVTGLAQDVDVSYPDPSIANGPVSGDAVRYKPMEETRVGKVRVRVEVDIACRIGFANNIICDRQVSGGVSWTMAVQAAMGGMLMKKLRAEAMYPYQGAEYVYR